MKIKLKLNKKKEEKLETKNVVMCSYDDISLDEMRFN